MVSQTWIIEYLKMLKISHKVKLNLESYAKLENGISDRWNDLKEIKNYHTLRLTLASAICYRNDATELYG